MNAPVQLLRDKFEMLAEWEQVKKQKDELAIRESALRRSLCLQFFDSPKEGTNTFALKPEDGWNLKMTHVIDRKVDEAVLENIKKDLLEKGIPVDSLVRYKPDLNVRAYKSLTDEQRKFFDQVLTIKDGSPQLKIEQNKVK